MSDPQFLDGDGNPRPRAILKTSFSAKGSEFAQVFREGRIAIYQLTSTEHGRVHFEVVIIQGHDGRVIKGAVVMPSEFYPSTSSWGILGWTFNERHLADAKAHELLVRFKIRQPGPARRRTPLVETVNPQSIAKDSTDERTVLPIANSATVEFTTP